MLKAVIITVHGEGGSDHRRNNNKKQALRARFFVENGSSRFSYIASDVV